MSNDLQEPLLLLNIKPSQQQQQPKSYKLLATILGCSIAILSQVILEHALSTQMQDMDIIALSFVWSLLICFMLMMGALALSHFSTTFETEAHYVIAALWSISLLWMVSDRMFMYPIILLLNLVLQRLPIATHALLSMTLGLMFGVTSQLVLSLIFWKDSRLTDPAVSNIWIFSTLWSVSTVLLTVFGCACLRCMGNSSKLVMIRMESYYIGSTLVGICLSWIGLDIIAGVPEQIVPVVLLLIMSLTCFAGILKCFPEESCIVADDDKQEKKAPILIV